MALAGKNGSSLCAVPDAQIGCHVRPVAFADYTSSLAAAEGFRRTRSRRTIYMQMLSRLFFTLQRVPFRKVHIPSGLDYRFASTDAETEAAVSPPMSVDTGADCEMNEAEIAGGGALTRYQQCMQRARLHTHCEKTVELNGHMDSMEQLMLARHESLCSARGNKAYMESEGDAADR
ncbi:hypothetical protein HPB52_013054 [Rhipicephalus sanguineus]|uniref:Uncharacterized protein n=1 Tax=Rhipicephalus sanguineus TaxID=34632 RepID=A0A9D4QEP6_RHISA|nr:hypothetical protein HPB52_013054 [Rhipicephalus sanguineus]